MLKKILILLILNVVLISAALAVISYLAVQESFNRSLQNRTALARIIANYVEVFLNDNLNRLHDISHSEKINLNDDNWEPERRMLENAYKYSLFTEGVFLLDKQGNVLLTYPPHIEYLSNLTYIDYVNRVFEYGRPVISNIYTIEPIKKPVIFMMTPVEDREGRIVGIAGGILGLTDNLIGKLLRSAKFEDNRYVEIIDSNEIVIASDKPSYVLQHHDHDSVLSTMIKEGKAGILECRHGFSHPDSPEKPTDTLAFVPLTVAPWGVIVGQAEQDLFATALSLRKEHSLFVLLFAITSLIFLVGITNKIVRPLRLLISSANRIASGDLTTPVGNLGSDEVLKLSRSFDDMREKLAESLWRIKTQKMELAQRVALRTRQIRESREKIQHLLKKIISSQEEERKRIARDLHDTILQDISAFLIKMDVCRLRPDLITVETIDEMREVAMKTIDDIHTVVKGLRPSLLDDLGIDAAIMWLLNKHLHKRGVNYTMDIKSPLKKRLPPEVEITLFRILQEAIINIGRHAHAENVSVTLDAGESQLEVSVEDDGDGMDLDEFMKYPVESGKGLGILGMMERASLLDGTLEILSSPGEGTKVCIRVPLRPQLRHVVLLVDDQKDFANSLAQRLKMRGLVTDIAYDGEEALSSLDERKPEVLVLDLDMPGVHGLEVLRHVREEHQDMPVIILTGGGADIDEEEARRLGAFAFFKKPPDIGVLAAKIKEAVEAVEHV